MGSVSLLQGKGERGEATISQESGQGCHGALQCNSGINDIACTGNMSQLAPELWSPRQDLRQWRKSNGKGFIILVIYIELETAHCS